MKRSVSTLAVDPWLSPMRRHRSLVPEKARCWSGACRGRDPHRCVAADVDQTTGEPRRSRSSWGTRSRGRLPRSATGHGCGRRNPVYGLTTGSRRCPGRVLRGLGGRGHPKRRSVDPLAAAVTPISALTAWAGTPWVGPPRGRGPGLVYGAAGGVGVFAVQLARWRRPLDRQPSAHNAAFVHGLGADKVIDYWALRFQDIVLGDRRGVRHGRRRDARPLLGRPEAGGWLDHDRRFVEGSGILAHARRLHCAAGSAATNETNRLIDAAQLAVGNNRG